jgi:maltooligosyltrehalose synthase
VVVFARRSEQATIVVVVPRLIAPLLRDRAQPCPAPTSWGDTRIELPADFAGRELVDQLTGQPVRASSGSLAIADVLADLPVALLAMS